MPANDPIGIVDNIGVSDVAPVSRNISIPLATSSTWLRAIGANPLGSG
jgi:hypothetical protein